MKISENIYRNVYAFVSLIKFTLINSVHIILYLINIIKYTI